MTKPDEFTLRVSPHELQVIVGCMHEAPYKLVAPLLDKLQAQVTAQQATANAAETAAA